MVFSLLKRFAPFCRFVNKAAFLLQIDFCRNRLSPKGISLPCFALASLLKAIDRHRSSPKDNRYEK